MALTLTEANKLSNDMLLAGIVATIVKESPLLAMLPFEEIVGNALTWNRENAMAGMGWNAVGGTWVEGTNTVTQKTIGLKIIGGDADVDNFLAATRRDTQDLAATVLEQKAKAFAHEFERVFWYGSIDADANEFDGVHELIQEDATAQDINIGSGSTPAALALSDIDELIDLIKPGKPDALFCSRRTRRGISVYARSLTSPINYEPNELGQRVMFYDGIPLFTSDFITDTETISSGAWATETGGASSSMFALKFGPGLLTGLRNGPLPTIEDIGALETKDARRYRVKGYCAAALFQPTAIARIDGISSAAVTAT